ncbi:MAG: glycosyltransferase [Syntrophales bacterium]
MVEKMKQVFPLPDGTVYSRRKKFEPFSVPPLEAYMSFLSNWKAEKLLRIIEKVKGIKVLEINATAKGGGVAEMLFSSIPFMNSIGVDTEWKTIHGTPEYYECTKNIHNIMQGKKGVFTPEMAETYRCTLEESSNVNLIDYEPNVVISHDPQPMGLAKHIKRPGQIWFWRCHIDIEGQTLDKNPGLFEFMRGWTHYYDAAIFSTAHYVAPGWAVPRFIIPPFIDPLSEKNRELSQKEIDAVLAKYNIDSRIPIIAQIGRFDPWKGLDRTIATYRLVRKERPCQLLLAGGIASDDPEGVRILNRILEETKNDENVHVLNLSLEDRIENWREVNALQRAATILMQPSTREGFGLVITEALWKRKPVITANVGAIPLQVLGGVTGYFYRNAPNTARKVLNLLDNPKEAAAMGESGRQYVKQHFLLPDRIADHLMAINLLVKGSINKDVCSECIISFHPWFKVRKR